MSLVVAFSGSYQQFWWHKFIFQYIIVGAKDNNDDRNEHRCCCATGHCDIFCPGFNGVSVQWLLKSTSISIFSKTTTQFAIRANTAIFVLFRAYILRKTNEYSIARKREKSALETERLSIDKIFQPNVRDYLFTTQKKYTQFWMDGKRCRRTVWDLIKPRKRWRHSWVELYYRDEKIHDGGRTKETPQNE